MQSGPRRHLVTIQSRSAVLDAVGQESDEGWANSKTAYCSIEQMSGKELEYGQAVAKEATYKLKMIYQSGITSDQRIIFGSRTFQILNVNNIKERNRELELLCKEFN